MSGFVESIIDILYKVLDVLLLGIVFISVVFCVEGGCVRRPADTVFGLEDIRGSFAYLE